MEKLTKEQSKKISPPKKKIIRLSEKTEKKNNFADSRDRESVKFDPLKMAEEPEKVSSSGDKKPEDVGIKPQVCDLLNFIPFRWINSRVCELT